MVSSPLVIYHHQPVTVASAVALSSAVLLFSFDQRSNTYARVLPKLTMLHGWLGEMGKRDPRQSKTMNSPKSGPAYARNKMVHGGLLSIAKSVGGRSHSRLQVSLSEVGKERTGKRANREKGERGKGQTGKRANGEKGERGRGGGGRYGMETG